jgi:hypothetical protein
VAPFRVTGDEQEIIGVQEIEDSATTITIFSFMLVPYRQTHMELLAWTFSHW